MNKNSQKLRDLLLNLINKQKQDLRGLVSEPDVNFSRNRKIPYENMILSLLTMEGATLTNELLRQFGCSTTNLPVNVSLIVNTAKIYASINLIGSIRDPLYDFFPVITMIIF